MKKCPFCGAPVEITDGFYEVNGQEYPTKIIAHVQRDNDCFGWIGSEDDRADFWENRV